MNKTDIKRTRFVLAGNRIGVFGKGGAGKSTAIVLLGNYLRELGYEVCILDADSTNIGLPLGLGIDQSPETLIDYFGGMIFSGGRVTCPVDDPTLLVGGELYLDELPSRYYRRNQAGITLLIAGKIGEKGAGAGCDGPISKVVRDLRIIGREENPVTLVDFKAGFEDTARGVITGLDWAIVLVDPTVAAVEMAANMRDMVYQIKNGKLPATRHLESLDLVTIANQLFIDARIKGVLFLLSKIGNSDVETYLRTRLSEHSIEPDGVIHEDPSISLAWLKGTPLDSQRSRADIACFVRKLEITEELYIAKSDIKIIEG